MIQSWPLHNWPYLRTRSMTTRNPHIRQKMFKRVILGWKCLFKVVSQWQVLQTELSDTCLVPKNFLSLESIHGNTWNSLPLSNEVITVSVIPASSKRDRQAQASEQNFKERAQTLETGREGCDLINPKSRFFSKKTQSVVENWRKESARLSFFFRDIR